MSSGRQQEGTSLAGQSDRIAAFCDELPCDEHSLELLHVESEVKGGGVPRGDIHSSDKSPKLLGLLDLAEAEAFDVLVVTEFAAQADVGESTRHKYRVHMREFVEWLAHPESGRGGRSQGLLWTSSAGT